MPDLVICVRKPADWSDTLFCYFWERSPGGDESSWPGVPMTLDRDGWYTCRFADTTAVRLVVNDGHGRQSKDLFRERDSWLDADGVWSDEEPMNAKYSQHQRPLTPAPAGAVAAPSAAGQREDFREETIFFLLTARFCDGDPSNNVFCRDRIRFDAAGEPIDPHWRGDFKGLIQRLDYMRDLGFTAIWITPPVESRSGLDYHGSHP